MLNLNRLHSLVLVADEGNLSRAARRLNVSQSALSRRVQELEKELGFAVFDRVGRGIVLTGQGRAFVAECRTLLSQAQAVEERAQAFAGGDSGVLRVGATPPMLERLFPAVLRHCRDCLAEVELQLIESSSSDLERLLLLGEIDLGVIPNPNEDRLAARPIAPLFVLAAIAKGRGFEAAAGIELDAVVEEPLLMLHLGFNSRQLFDAACGLAGLKPEIAIESGNLHTLLALAEAGHGVAVIPSSATMRGYLLDVLPLLRNGRALEIPNAVCWVEERHRPSYVTRFIDELAAQAEQTLVGSGLPNP